MSVSMDVSESNVAVDAAVDAAVETADTAGTDTSVHPISEKLDILSLAASDVLEKVKIMQATLKAITKDKDLKKMCKKRKKMSGAPSNLMKPIRISDELCSFLGIDAGARVTRGQVTSMINNYACSHQLKKQGNGRVIVIDAGLSTLLGLAVGDEVGVFNLPSHLKKRNHYLAEDASP